MHLNVVEWAVKEGYFRVPAIARLLDEVAASGFSINLKGHKKCKFGNEGRTFDNHNGYPPNFCSVWVGDWTISFEFLVQQNAG